MILSKDSNNNWVPTAGGTGTFIGTLAAFNAIKDTLPVNTVAYITDDGVSFSSLFDITKSQSNTMSLVGGERGVIWEISHDKSGYKPIAFSLIYPYSSTTTTAVEVATLTDGRIYLSGYCGNEASVAVTLAIDALVTWVKI